MGIVCRVNLVIKFKTCCPSKVRACGVESTRNSKYILIGCRHSATFMHSRNMKGNVNSNLGCASVTGKLWTIWSMISWLRWPTRLLVQVVPLMSAWIICFSTTIMYQLAKKLIEYDPVQVIVICGPNGIWSYGFCQLGVFIFLPSLWPLTEPFCFSSKL